MKILILGANGMLGHAIHRSLHGAHDVTGSVRSPHRPEAPSCAGLNYLSKVDAARFPSVALAVEQVKPDVIINALGVIKQRAESGDDWTLIQINAAFPRKLQQLSTQAGAKLIHFSTDCVFAGTVGNYSESDVPDATDWYGVSKYLGECAEGTALTLRTSIIGRGLAANNSLVDWFLAQRGDVAGFSRAIFSGLPVNEVGKFLNQYLEHGLMELNGLYHLSAAPISKYDLVCLIREQWSASEIRVKNSPDFVIDRSLDSSRLREKLNYAPAAWPQLIKEMFKFYKD